VRRILAFLLLGLFSFALIAPALSAANADSQLPACCRRAGKHHCGQTSGSSGFNAARCAHFPQISVIPAPTAAVTGAIQSGKTALIVERSNASRTEAHPQIVHARANQKRGPPTRFS